MVRYSRVSPAQIQALRAEVVQSRQLLALLVRKAGGRIEITRQEYMSIVGTNRGKHVLWTHDDPISGAHVIEVVQQQEMASYG